MKPNYQLRLPSYLYGTFLFLLLYLSVLICYPAVGSDKVERELTPQFINLSIQDGKLPLDKASQNSKQDLKLVTKNPLLYDEDYDSEEDENWEYSIPQTPPAEEDIDSVLIPFFRGIHLFPEKFPSSEDRARFLCQSEVETPVFSTSPFKILGLNFGKQSPDKEQELICKAKEVKKKIKELKGKLPIKIKDKSYDPYTALHYSYVNSYTDFISNLEGFCSKVFQDFQFKGNPLVSVSETPNHPLRYAFGLKIDEKNALKPCFDEKGKPRNPYLGKIYVMLVPLYKTREDKVFRMMEASAKDQMKVNYRIKFEREAAFPGLIPGKYVVYERIVRVPNFKHEWSEKHARKYGLTKKIYSNTKKNILATKGDRTKQEGLYKKLVEDIVKETKNNWSSQLTQIAKREALKRKAHIRHLDLYRLASSIPMNNGKEAEDAEANLAEYKRILGDVDLTSTALNQYNAKGATALMRVCENPTLTEDVAYRLIEFIIEKGADVKISHQKTKKTALHMAASFNKTRIMKLLLDNGANINAQARDGATPLIFASAFYGNVKAICLLTNSGANLNAVTYSAPEITSGGGETALHYAIQEGFVGNIKALIKLGADTTIPTKNGIRIIDQLNTSHKLRKIGDDNYHDLDRLFQKVASNPSCQKELKIDFNELALIGDFNPLENFIITNDVEEVSKKISSNKLTESQLKSGFETAVIQVNTEIIPLFSEKLPQTYRIDIINKWQEKFRGIRGKRNQELESLNPKNGKDRIRELKEAISYLDGNIKYFEEVKLGNSENKMGFYNEAPKLQ